MWWWDDRRKRPAARRRRRTKRRTFTNVVEGLRAEASARPSGRSGKRRKNATRGSRRLTIPRLSRARWLSLGLLVGVCILGRQLLSSPEFQVQQIEVEGNRLLSAQLISEATGIRGVNILYVNTHQVEQRLSQLSLVRDAKVSIQLPNRVRVQVTERQPVVTWVSGGTRVGVDEEGVILPPQAVDPQAITVEALETDTPEAKLQVEPKAIAVALALHKLRPDLRRFLLHPERGIGIVTQEGWPVYFGWETRDLPVQLEILERARPALRQEGEGIEYVDLRYPSAPYYHRLQR